MDIPFIDKQALYRLLPYNQLIPALKEAFQQDYVIPQRHHHDYQNPTETVDSTLLLMPAWQVGTYLGVKIVTVHPNNSQYNLPAVQGIYILSDAVKGMPLAYLEAKTLTTLRTAAASALASSFLSRPDSDSLLMIGTGAMAPELIKAHATIRPIKKVFVWGRNYEKAIQVQIALQNQPFEIQAVKTINSIISKVAIISCATFSETPLVLGDYLVPGQHVDLVGSFKPDMREADDSVIHRSKLYVDVIEGATKETGDLVIPLKTGLISIEDIQGDLFSLCRAEIVGRNNNHSITCFKSVGYALEDLAAAKLAFEAL